MSTPGNVTTRSALVIDDEPEIAEFVAEVLELSDFVVDFITDVVSLESCEEQCFSLVVLDLMMPNEGGASLLPKLAGCPVPPAIILMSGDVAGVIDDARDTAEALGLRVIGCLRKPFFAADIEALLNDL